MDATTGTAFRKLMTAVCTLHIFNPGAVVRGHCQQCPSTSPVRASVVKVLAAIEILKCMVCKHRSRATTLRRCVRWRVSHMVWHDIHDDGHASSPAPRNHVGKLGLAAGARVELVGERNHQLGAFLSSWAGDT